MKKLMIKFSDERNKKYSIKTVILEKDGCKRVEKSAVYPEGQEHLKQIASYCERLKEAYPDVDICPAEYRNEKLEFPFVEGESMEERYRRLMRSGDVQGIESLIVSHAKLVEGRPENRTVFHSGGDFEAIFGKWEVFEGTPGLKVSNFDGIAGNVLFQGEQPVFIDYEWVFLFPVPRDLVVYHCINDLYYHIPKLQKLVTVERAMELAKVTLPIKAMYQAYVNFHSSIIRESDGRSYGGKKARALKSSMSEAELAAHYQEALESIGQLKQLNAQMETYWRDCSQANAKLTAKINSLKDENARLQAALNELENRRAHEVASWQEAYNSVINSKTWKLAKKAKRLIGKR